MAAFLISIMIHGHKDQTDYNENKAEDFIIAHYASPPFKDTALTAVPSGMINDLPFLIRGWPPTVMAVPKLQFQEELGIQQMYAANLMEFPLHSSRFTFD